MPLGPCIPPTANMPCHLVKASQLAWLNCVLCLPAVTCPMYSMSFVKGLRFLLFIQQMSVCFRKISIIQTSVQSKQLEVCARTSASAPCDGQSTCHHQSTYSASQQTVDSLHLTPLSFFFGGGYCITSDTCLQCSYAVQPNALQQRQHAITLPTKF